MGRPRVSCARARGARQWRAGDQAREAQREHECVQRVEAGQGRAAQRRSALEDLGDGLTNEWRGAHDSGRDSRRPEALLVPGQKVARQRKRQVDVTRID